MPKIRPVLKKIAAVFDDALVRAWKKVPFSNISGPIFIIGPPRSGTTLAYQLITSCFDVSYISNFEARRIYTGGFSAIIGEVIRPNDQAQNQFSSDYGRTPGRFGPHEAGQLWYRWFPEGDNVYVKDGDLGAEKIDNMRKHIAFLQQVKKRPIVFKNVYNSARVGVLKSVFPKAIFIVIRRDSLEVAQSILRAREKVGFGRDKWWSLPLPPSVGEPENMPWSEQIIRQVTDVYSEIDGQLGGAKSGQFFEVDYNRLCENPEEIIDNLGIFLNSQGIRVKRTGEPPKCFDKGPSVSVSQDDYSALQQALSYVESRKVKVK